MATGSQAPVSRLNQASLGIPGEKERYQIYRDLTIKKINTMLLPLMRKYEIDMWITLDREYHPDPFQRDIGGRGGVRNAYIFYDNGETLEKIFIFSHGSRDDLVTNLYDELIHYGYRPEGLRPHLKDAVTKRNPRKIALNMSPTLPMADGLTVELKKYLDEAIGPELAAREVSSELLLRDFRTIRMPEETEVYRKLIEWTLLWAEEGLSRVAITPGKTTTDDVHWWWREKAKDMGIDIASFLPGLGIRRRGQNFPMNDPDTPIMPGDVLHMDAGMNFIHLHSDMQRMAYVLRPGETDVPAGLQRALDDANLVTDQYAANMKPGELGWHVWRKTMDWCNERMYETAYAMGGGARPAPGAKEVGIYGHSVGGDVHDIGARVAEDNPVGFGDRVRYPLQAPTWNSIELHVGTPVPEWDGQMVRIGIEEPSILNEDGLEFFVPRQRKWLLIPSD